MNLVDQVAFVSSHILVLPYDDRPEALALVHYWRLKKRLSQWQQLRLDKYENQIRDARNKKNNNGVVRSTQHGSEADST